MTRVEEAKAALWGQLVDSGELHEEDAIVLLDNLVDAAKEEDILDLLSKAGADGFAEGVEFATMELALKNPPVLHGKLPVSYGDSLPIKDMPCGDSCLWGGA